MNSRLDCISADLGFYPQHSVGVAAVRLTVCLLLLLASWSQAQTPTRTQILPLDQTWRYNQADNLDRQTWKAVDFDDSSWGSGPALLFSETNEMVMPRNTELELGRNTYYFRTHFALADKPSGLALAFTCFVDDGAVFYLNGTEIYRLRMPLAPSAINYATAATESPLPDSDASLPDYFLIAGNLLTNLVVGDNVLAVEVHQVSTTSSDVVFGAAVEAIVDPAFRWVVRGGSTGADEGRAAALDASGNAYVFGNFTGNASFGATNFVSRGSTDVVLNKYDSAGNLIWAQQFGGTSGDSASGLALDAQGNALVTGPYSGNITIGSLVLTGISNPQSNHFVAKISAAGEVLWATRGDGSSSRIAADAAGNAYVAGQFSRTATLGGVTLTATNALNVHVAKYDPSGKLLWAQVAGANKTPVTATSQSIGIAADPAGNSFVSTTFNTPATFGGTTTLSNKSADDIFLVKYTTSGALAWVQQIGGGVRNQEHGVAADASGNVYVVAGFQGTADFGSTTLTSDSGFGLLLAKYDSAGTLLWARAASGTNNTRSIAVDGVGSVYVSGQFSSPLSFPTAAITNQGVGDVFVAKFTNDGQLAWLRQMGSSAADNSLGLGVDAAGNVVLSGLFNGTAVFGGLTATSRGSSDLFVVAIGGTVNTRPRLNVAAGDGTVVLSWSKTATGFGLETSSAVAGAPWAAVSTPAVEVGDQLQVTLPDSNGTRFFRLSK